MGTSRPCSWQISGLHDSLLYEMIKTLKRFSPNRPQPVLNGSTSGGKKKGVQREHRPAKEKKRI